MSDEALQVVDNLVARPPNGSTMTPAQFASYLGKCSAEAKKQRKLQAIKNLKENPPVALPPVQPLIIQETTVIQQLHTEQPSAELSRARMQLETANNRLQTALEAPKTLPIDIERLTRSVTSLRESVRILSGIPLPGSHKPMPQRAGRRSSYDVAEPADPTIPS